MYHRFYSPLYPAGDAVLPINLQTRKEVDSMKKLHKLLALMMALTLVFALCACSSSNDSSTSGTSGTSDNSGSTNDTAGDSSTSDTVDLSGKTIGYVTITSTAPWGGRVGTEFIRLAKEAGATVKDLDAQTVADDVVNYCMQMIDQKVDALVVFGGDPTAMVDVAKACSKANIPLFTCNTDVAEEGREYATATIGPDQEEMCYEIAQRVIADNGTDEEKTVVQISGVPFLKDYQDRQAGFERGMAEASNYDLLEADYAYSSRTDAKTFMEQHIQVLGSDIDVVMGFDDDLTMGAVAAIEEAGLTGSIKVYSITGQNDAIQAVKDGQLELTVMYRADAIAEETVNALNEYFTTGTTEYFHRLDVTYITAENVDQYIGKGEF
jgi:ABC-type sugar transport system substrate-binding protein